MSTDFALAVRTFDGPTADVASSGRSASVQRGCIDGEEDGGWEVEGGRGATTVQMTSSGGTPRALHRLPQRVAMD